MEFSAFVTSVSTLFLIFVVLVLIFTWLSRKPSNEVIYYPSRLLKGMDPFDGRRTKNPFAWIGEAFNSSEQDLIAMAGVDAAVYFVFMNTALGILVISGIILLPILLPVSATDINLSLTLKKASSVNDTSSGTFNNLDNLTMSNVQNASTRLWAFLLGTYWVSFVTYYLLWKAYKHVSNIRASALATTDARPEQFAILVRDIPHPPSGQTRKEQVDSYFRSLHPETFYRSFVITDNKMANKIYKELESYRKKLGRAEVVLSKSKTSGKPEGARPTNKTGFLGLIGPKVDTIDYCNEKIKELVPKLETEQKTTLREKQQACALVFFNSRPAAVIASQTVHAQLLDTWTIIEAPEPRQLLWTSLKFKFYEREVRQYLVYGIVFLAILFYMIPITFISALTTLKNLRTYLPFLKPVIDQPEIKTILEAYIPQIALIVFLALLPKFLMILSKAEGIASQSHAVRAAAGKYFYFMVFNVFLGFTLSSTLFSSLKTITDHPGSLYKMLGANLPKSATFFLTFVALKFFVGYGLELSRLVPLVIYHLKKKFLCKTEADIKEAWYPEDLSYATRFPNDMLIITIVLCYSVIAPLIIPFGVIYFGLGWLVLRNQALKVYVPLYESYGRMWPHMHARILAALLLYQVTMLGYFVLRVFYYAAFVFPLLGMTFIFTFVCNKRYYGAFCNTPLEIACHNLKESPHLESMFEAYIPPSLKSDKYDDAYQYEDAASQPSKMGSGSAA